MRNFQKKLSFHTFDQIRNIIVSKNHYVPEASQPSKSAAPKKTIFLPALTGNSLFSLRKT